MREQVCKGCGQRKDYPTEILRYGEDGYYCKACAKSILKRCSCCKRRRAQNYTLQNGDSICTACALKNNYKQCSKCKKLHQEKLINKKTHNLFVEAGLIQRNQKSFCETCSNSLQKKVEAMDTVNCHCCGTPTLVTENNHMLVGKRNGNYKSKPTDKQLCNACNGRIYWCVICKAYHNTNKTLTKTNPNNDLVCEKAWRQHYFNCQICRKPHNKSEKSELGRICKPCSEKLAHCPNCDRLVDKDQLQKIDGMSVCTPCHASAKRCAECGTKSLTTQPIWEPPNTHYCADCRHKKGKARKHGWRHRPVFQIHAANESDLTIGFENEVSISSQYDQEKVANAITKHFHENFVYIMHDGTIDRGFEIVTHPMSYEVFQDMDIKALLPKGVVKSKTTGMHVHISRKAFTEYSLYLFMRFISTNPNFITKIAGREAGGSAQWRLSPEDILVDKAKGKDGQDKYVDVNIKHKDSIEIRIFKGATTEEEIRRNVQFVYALALYTNTNTPKLTPKAFSNWVLESLSSKDFKELHTYLRNPTSFPQEASETSYKKPITEDVFNKATKKKKEVIPDPLRWVIGNDTYTTTLSQG